MGLRSRARVLGLAEEEAGAGGGGRGGRRQEQALSRGRVGDIAGSVCCTLVACVVAV